MKLLIKNSGKKLPDIKKQLLSLKSDSVTIVDYVYPLTKLKNGSYPIKDHINLSGYNPLTGPVFISLTDVYKTKSGIVIVGLKDGSYPNEHEKKVLLKLGVKAYSYNIVPAVIFAASLNLRIKAFGVVE